MNQALHDAHRELSKWLNEEQIKPIDRLALATVLGAVAAPESSGERAALLRDLAAACDGHPNAQIPWPHRLLHRAIDMLAADAQKGDEATDEMLFHGLEIYKNKQIRGYGGNVHKRTEKERMRNAYRAMVTIASRSRVRAGPTQQVAVPRERIRSQLNYIAAYDLDELDGMTRDKLLMRVRAIITGARHTLFAAPQPPQADAPELTSLCARCHGEGIVHTGVDESPTMMCLACDGRGTTPPAPKAQPLAMTEELTKAMFANCAQHPKAVEFSNFNWFTAGVAVAEAARAEQAARAES